MMILILLTTLVFAQTVSQPTKKEPPGKLSGVILDAGNARVPKAKIVVERKGFRDEAISADDGTYEIDLPVNSYTITVVRDGFYPTWVAGVQIRSDAVTKLNVVIRGISVDDQLFSLGEEISTETAVPNNSVELRRPKSKP